MYNLVTKKPFACSTEEIDQFYNFVKYIAKNQEDNLRNHILACEWLLMLMDQNKIIATAAVKNPHPHYVHAMQDLAQVPLFGYNHEVGYRAVDLSYRGFGLGQLLADTMVAMGKPCWATNRIENTIATEQLIKAGMKVVREEFKSPNGDYKCRLLCTI